ncbi:DnaJ-domain-containing protein [Haematococcus lacustris]
MAAEILPEVKARQEAEKAAKEAERVKQAERLAAGKDLKLPTFNSSDSEEEPEPDAKIEIPFNKMKYVVGPGGVKIQEIQRKSKARVQIIKEEAEMTKAWGSGPTPTFKQQNLEYAAAMVTLLLYGNQHAVEAAERMIMEAIDNREQKQKQRARDYEKKREEKARLRQMYHMRHSRDYEILELPMGASKAEVKKAYRKLAMKWHPDKHSEEDQEMAKAKFQEIQKAYDRLLSSAEDEKVEAIAC